jgi:hypothetical protein
MLTKRNVIVVDYRDLDSEFLRPELILIKLDDSVRVYPIDIGSWAYSVRDKAILGTGKDATNSRIAGLSVDTSSLHKERVEFIRSFLDLTAISGWKQTTFSTVYNCIGLCLEWCDGNDHSSLFISISATREAYFAYMSFLDSEIKVGRIKPRTAWALQNTFKRIIKCFWPKSADDILRGIPTIFYNRESIDLPYEKEIGQYIDVSLALSTQMSAAIIENRPFPWVFSFGSYNAAIYPSSRGPKTPFNPDIPQTRHPVHNRLKTLSEFLEGVPEDDKSNIHLKTSNFQKCLDGFEKNNSNSRSYFRMVYAGNSMVAYLALLQMITGAPASELLSVEYADDEYVLENDGVKRELSSVKFRAAGKVVRYPLGDIGLRILKEYLTLRSWILGGESHEYLFFKLCRLKGSETWKVKRFNSAFSTLYITRLRGLYLPHDAPNVARFGRQFKSLLLHVLKTKPGVIAPLLNHSEKTNSSTYSHVSPDIQHNELAGYWVAVRAAADVVKNEKAQGNAIAAGHCKSFDNPSAVIDTPPIEPDCKVQQGCLYCEHYVCHADEEDVQKLLSLKYVLCEIRNSSVDIEHAEYLFKDLSIRIDFILEGVMAKSSAHMAMVQKAEKRVFKLGELTPFWEMRMARYEKMGVVV